MPVDAVKEGLKTYLHKMFELDWMRMAPDADYQDMIEYGVHCIKVAAGMPSGFLDDETQPAEVNDRQAQ